MRFISYRGLELMSFNIRLAEGTDSAEGFVSGHFSDAGNQVAFESGEVAVSGYRQQALEREYQ